MVYFFLQDLTLLFLVEYLRHELSGFVTVITFSKRHRIKVSIVASRVSIAIDTSTKES